MGAAPSGDDWLYHLPQFLAQIREQGAHRIVAQQDADFGGVVYHHRGVRVPAYDATFLWREETFELELDAVGPRSARATFDATADWDFYLSQAPGDTPCLAWMTDAEYRAEEADTFESKTEAVGLGRFSFGLYLQPPDLWADLEARVRDSEAPCFIHRPSGRMLDPGRDLAAYDEAVPPEVLPGGESPPAHLGLLETHIAIDR